MDKSIFDFLELQNKEKFNQMFSTNNVTDNCIKDDYCVIASNENDSSVLTMAFVNMQPLDSVYELDEAFKNGTLFPNLNKRFYGGMQK